MRRQLHLGTRGAAPRGFRVTARDKAIVRWIGRLRMATAAQVADRFELGRTVTYGRLSGLVHLGLLHHARIFHAEPGVYWATRSGLSIVDLHLPPARIDVRSYVHDVELSSLVTELEREFGPEKLRTEREMRSTDAGSAIGAPNLQRFAVSLSDRIVEAQVTASGRPRLHFPDCAVLDTADQATKTLLAVELERTAKGRTRLRRIIAGYVAARHIGTVRYYTVGKRVRDLVNSEVAAQRAHSLIDVRDWPLNRDSCADAHAAA